MAGLELVSRMELVVELERGSGAGHLWISGACCGLVPSRGREPLGGDYARWSWIIGSSHRLAASPLNP